MSELHTYTVKGPLKCDGEDYKDGDPIELCEKKAQPLLNVKVIEGPVVFDNGNVVPLKETTTAPNQLNPSRKPAPEDPVERVEAIKAAIGKLEPGNESHWTKDKYPDARALTELLGWSVKAEERNQIWMDMLAEQEGNS